MKKDRYIVNSKFQCWRVRVFGSGSLVSKIRIGTRSVLIFGTGSRTGTEFDLCFFVEEPDLESDSQFHLRVESDSQFHLHVEWDSRFHLRVESDSGFHLCVELNQKTNIFGKKIFEIKKD